MTIKLVKEVSPHTVIVDVKTETYEGRKLISREDYVAKRISFETSYPSEGPLQNRGYQYFKRK